MKYDFWKGDIVKNKYCYIIEIIIKLINFIFR